MLENQAAQPFAPTTHLSPKENTLVASTSSSCDPPEEVLPDEPVALEILPSQDLTDDNTGLEENLTEAHELEIQEEKKKED